MLNPQPQAADSDDETASGLLDLLEVEDAQVVHEHSMVHRAERLRVVYRGSVAQSSSDPPIPNSYLWSSIHGAIASISYTDALQPIATALSTSDAELFSLAHAMGAVPVLGLAENRPSSSKGDRDPDGYEGDRDEQDEHRRWHRGNDEYMHLTRGQSSSSSTSVSVATQTDFVQVLFPIGMLIGPRAQPYSHPHAFNYDETNEIE